MKKALLVLLALVVMAGVAFLYLRSKQPDEVVEPTADQATVESTAQLQEKLEATESERVRLDEELQAAQERISALEADAAKVEDASAESAPTKVEPAEDEPDKSIHDMDHEAAMELIRSKIRESAQATMQVDAMTEMFYADILDSLGLEPDLKAEVKAMFRESVVEFMAIQAFAMESRDVTWAESAEWRNQNRALLNEQLNPILPAEARAQWSTFAADMDAHVLDATLRNEVGMFARGLTPENFESVIQVGVEEFWGSQSAIEQTDAVFNAVSSVEVRREAIQGMRERLGQVLPEDQFAEVERYLTFADNALNAQQAQAERNAAERAESGQDNQKVAQR